MKNLRGVVIVSDQCTNHITCSSYRQVFCLFGHLAKLYSICCPKIFENEKNYGDVWHQNAKYYNDTTCNFLDKMQTNLLLLWAIPAFLKTATDGSTDTKKGSIVQRWLYNINLRKLKIHSLNLLQYQNTNKKFETKKTTFLKFISKTTTYNTIVQLTITAILLLWSYIPSTYQQIVVQY